MDTYYGYLDSHALEERRYAAKSLSNWASDPLK